MVSDLTVLILKPFLIVSEEIQVIHLNRHNFICLISVFFSDFLKGTY